MNIRLLIGTIYRTILQSNSPWIIALMYGDFWRYRDNLIRGGVKLTPKLYTAYLDRFNCFIGLNASIIDTPQFPHGLCGIFISNSAKIGKGVIIYQHVTIGSNTIKGSKGYGAPSIDDGVLIGAGANIIGNVKVGRNSRIGAGCVVTKDVPEDSVVVMEAPRVISKVKLVNEFVVNRGSVF